MSHEIINYCEFSCAFEDIYILIIKDEEKRKKEAEDKRKKEKDEKRKKDEEEKTKKSAKKKSNIELNDITQSTVELTDVFNLNYSYYDNQTFSLEESKSDFEKIFNTDLSDVNIHTGAYAEELATK